MNKLVLLIGFLCFTITSSLDAQSLFTDLTYDQVLQKAKSEKIPYYIDLTASWCLPCKLMDETVFQDQLVKQYTAENYLAIQLDVEDFDAMILKSEYQVRSLPTILFFNHKGKLIGKEEGLQTGTRFLEILKEYI